MSQRVTALAICEGALRKIGALSPYENGADAAIMAVAIDRLDLMLAEMSGEGRYWWLVPATQTFNTVAGQAAYDLNALLNANLVTVERAYMRREGQDTELYLMSRREYEAVRNKTDTGVVCSAYIDRLNVPTMHLVKVPNEVVEIRLVGQGDTADVAQNRGEISHGFPKSWQRYLELRLACDLGDNTINGIPDGEMERMKKQADDLLLKLKHYSGMEQVARPRHVAYRDL